MAGARRFRYGLQIDDIPDPVTDTRDVGPGFSADLQRSNLFGRAATIGTAMRYDITHQAVRSYFSTPRFFHLPVTSSFYAQEEWEQQGDLDSRETRLTFEQRYRAQRSTQVNYGYFYRRTRTNTIIDVLGQLVPLRPSSITPACIRQSPSIDEMIHSTPGVAGSTLRRSSTRPRSPGFDVRSVRYVVQQSYFHPMGTRFVAAVNGRLGLADAFDEQQLIENERFFAGGGGTVRGYKEDSLSPRIFDQRIGGEALVIFNSELRFHVSRRIRGVAFLDAGNAFLQPTDIDFSDLEVGAGFGVRFVTPVGLLRLDFGIPVSRGGGFGDGRFHFSFGQVF